MSKKANLTKGKTNIKTPKNKVNPVAIWKYFVLAFIEGATVMAVELFGAKMMTPYYGSSLIVWTTVIGITLLCLTIGYFLGGRLSMKHNPKKLVFVQLTISALLIGIMPIIAHSVLKFTGDLNFYLGAVFSAILLFGVPLIFLGSTSPVIILLATKQVEKAGKNAGLVYSISTLGGIFMTFLLGFFIIEQYGITGPNMVVSAVLLTTTLLLLYRNSSMIFTAIVALIFIVESVGVYKSTLQLSGSSASFNILYESEGLLGQLRVLDEHYPDLEITDRSMLVNGIPQTFVNAANCHSYWYYVHMLSTICSSKPAGSDVLLLGFGGGSVASELTRLDLNIDAIEIDNRMYQLAEDYFLFDAKNTSFIVDDARHYLKTATKKYDVIIFDMIKGEVQPPYALTQESFKEGLKILKPGGLLLVNFQGHFDEQEGLPFRSIVATLKAAGFSNTVFHVENCEPNSPCDFIVIGSVDVPDISLDPSRLNKCCLAEGFVTSLLNGSRDWETNVGKGEAIVFTDDLPILEHINLKSIVEWRTAMIDNNAKKSLEEGVRLFK